MTGTENVSMQTELVNLIDTTVSMVFTAVLLRQVIVSVVIKTEL